MRLEGQSDRLMVWKRMADGHRDGQSLFEPEVGEVVRDQLVAQEVVNFSTA